MMRTNYRTPAHKFRGRPDRMVLKPTGTGKVKRPRFTGAHKFLSRTDMVCLLAKLGG